MALLPYRQPGVEVTEEFTELAAALALFNLPNINVGPAFQVVTQGVAGNYAGSSANYDYPGQIAGTLVDTRASDPEDLINYPVSLFLKNMVISYLSSSAGAISGGNLNQITDATSAIFANTLAGDVIVVTGSGVGNNGNYTVRQKVDNNTLIVNETFTSAQATVTYTIRRNLQATVGTYSLPTSTSGVVVSQDEVTLPSGLTYVHAVFGSKPIISASLLISYRAQRLELSADVTNLTTTQALQAAFGVDQIVPENPLAFAAFLALGNAAGTTQVLALDFQYLNDEVLSYTDAFAILENEDTYAINVLTQSTSVATALNAHVLAMSAPAKKLERVGITNRKLVTTAVVVDSKTTTGGDGITGPSGGPFLTLLDANAHFLTDGVVPGMYAKIAAPSGVAGRFKIAAVNSQTKLTLVSPGPSTSATGVNYLIDKDLSKDDQATFVAEYAASIGSRRLVVTWPDVVKIPVGANIRRLPGYFLGASVGAMTTGLPTQQGFTNRNVAVYTGVEHSTKYFTNDQLNVLASGGVMIFVQNQLDVTALYIRHQLTTDRSAIKFQEFSITKNVDFIAKFIRLQHKDFPGKYNIVDGAFDDLRTSASGIIKFLRDDNIKPKIGGIIKSGKLTSVIQDSANIDTIKETWSLDIPIPLNNLDITIFV